VRPSARISCLAVAFTLSGAAALLAEQVFEKLLSTLVGATTPAGAIVLSVYFAGLTTGALLYPSLRRLRHGAWLASYPVLEVLVAAACLVLVWRFDSLVPMFAPLLRIGVGKPLLLALMRGVVAAAWILPLTIPMGATFPAIIDVADRVAPESRARSVSALYAFNLVGAILAAVGAPIALFPVLGMSGGLWIAAAFDVIAALLALLVLSSARAIPEPDRLETSAPSASLERVPVQLLVFAFATGFVLFALEVTWTHLACAVIGNSVYAFAAMLSSVLIGLGLGSIASALLFGRSPRVPSWTPGAALVAGAVTLSATHEAWPHAPRLVAWLGSQATSFAGQELARFATAACVVVPPAAVLGAAYPLIFRVPSFPSNERGGAAGRVAGVNALGCIAGSIAIGFFVLPRFGSDATLRALAGLAALAGIAAVLFAGETRARTPLVVGGVVALLAVFVLPPWDRLALTAGEHVYFARQYVTEVSELLSFHEDTLGGITTVIGTRTGEPRETEPRTLLTNGKFQGNDRSEMSAQTSFAIVPMQYVRSFDRALVIGLGTGRTAYVVDAMGFRNVDVAEIAPGIVAASREFFPDVNHHVLDEPNVSLFLEDGRNLLLLRDTTYDLVTIELTSVWFAGVTNLYSREFYALVRDRLREGGVMQQWIQLHHITIVEVASVLATVHEIFPYVSFFAVGGQGIIVASFSPEEVQPAFVEHVRSAHADRLLGVADDSAAIALLVSSRILAPVDVDRLSRFPDVHLNTDGNRFLEYATPRYNYRRDDMIGANVVALVSLASSPAIAIAPGVDERARTAIARASEAAR
jgi:spermidine synthase